jgi:hypothetical protein
MKYTNFEFLRYEIPYAILDITDVYEAAAFTVVSWGA